MHGHHYRRSAKNVHAMCVVDLLRNLDDQNINEVDCCLAKVMMGIDGCFILMFPPRLQQPVVLPSVGTGNAAAAAASVLSSLHRAGHCHHSGEFTPVDRDLTNKCVDFINQI